MPRKRDIRVRHRLHEFVLQPPEDTRIIQEVERQHRQRLCCCFGARAEENNPFVREALNALFTRGEVAVPDDFEDGFAVRLGGLLPLQNVDDQFFNRLYG